LGVNQRQHGCGLDALLDYVSRRAPLLFLLQKLIQASGLTIAEGEAACLVLEGNPERLASVAFSALEGLMAETKELLC
jgi:hypothetical protein